jgi:TPR repeat protein
MKTRLALLFLSVAAVSAQVGTSPRTLTRRIAPPPPPSARPAQVATPAPGAAAQPAAPLSKAAQDSQNAKAAAEDKKKLDWQKERAAAGSASVQYDLAIRYLDGKGVEKDAAEAKKWLKESAKSGNEKAKAKLAELEK